MTNNDIGTAQLSADDLTAIKAAFAIIESKLPFLQPLSGTQRKEMPKAGPERQSYIENSLQAAQNNPAIMPASFDSPGFASRMDLFQVMGDINTTAAQLASKIDDTHMKLGSLLMADSSDAHKYVKTAAKNTPGLKPVADQLGALYQKAVATRRANKKAKDDQAGAK